MIRQQGSILVGVLVISATMALAGGAFIILAGNADRDVGISESDYNLHYAAESAMQMGAGWIRGHDSAFHDPTWAGNTELTIGADGYALIEGVWTRCSILGQPAAGPPIRSLNCTATYGARRDTLNISWTLDSVRRDTYIATQSRPYFSNWTETYRPGRP